MRVFNMMYTVNELSNMLKVSKVSIYNKLKLKEIEPYIIKNKGITYVKDEGFNLIKDSLSFKAFNQDNRENDTLNENEPINEEAGSIDNEEFKVDFNYIKDYVETLKQDKENLWQQLQEKDKQISELLLRIETMGKLVENSQVLLKEKEEQDPLLLEEHFQELDKKIEDMKEKLEYRQNKNKKSFWEKFK